MRIASNPVNFNARVTMDLRCKNYYEKCKNFREMVNVIESDVKADEVSLSADRNRHWSGTREIYAQSEHKNGEIEDYKIGTIDEGSYTGSRKITFNDRFSSEYNGIYDTPAEYYNMKLYYA